MSRLVMITGGARSGKSTFAEKELHDNYDRVGYIATAIAFDDGMKDRIKKHQDQRPDNWGTIEWYKGIENLKTSEVFRDYDVFLLDCLTLMVTNQMIDEPRDFDTMTMEEVNQLEQSIFQEVKALLALMKKEDKTLYVVSNEVGMGLVPAYKLGNYFRDIAGRMNQYVASLADDVHVLFSGIPMKIK